MKYHFKTNQGIEILSQEAANQIAGEDADFHIRDLGEAIDRGDFPSWTLSVQIMPYAEAATYRFNPFDLTKVWPHSDYPLHRVGTLTLNRNPANYFAEIEQATFAPSNFVPGIAASPDKMLLARIFSYADAHRYRVGTNHAQLPVNAPHAAEVHSYAKDGAARYAYNPASVPVYAPNSVGGPAASPDAAGDSAGWQNDGELQRTAATLHAEDDDFGQAGTLVREVLDDAARERLANNIAGHVGQVTIPEIKARALQYWRNVGRVASRPGRSAAHRCGWRRRHRPRGSAAERRRPQPRIRGRRLSHGVAGSYRLLPDRGAELGKYSSSSRHCRSAGSISCCAVLCCAVLPGPGRARESLGPACDRRETGVYSMWNSSHRIVQSE